MLREAQWVLAMEITRKRSARNGDLCIPATGGVTEGVDKTVQGETQGKNVTEELRRKQPKPQIKAEETFKKE